MNLYKLLLGILLWIVPLTLFGQRYVSGRVTDAEDGEPIPGVSVFIDGSAVGITTDSAGYYRLTIPGSGSYKLVASHAGYQLFSKEIETGQKSTVLDVALYFRTLDEVKVTETVKARKEDIILFWRKILGKQPDKTIFATNPEKVFYYYNPKSRILTVSCPVPLQISNLKTGYHIEYILDRFTHDYNTNASFWSAQFMFKELEPEDTKQKNSWIKNRENVYRVSLSNFIKALYNDSLMENGFFIAQKCYRPAISC